MPIGLPIIVWTYGWNPEPEQPIRKRYWHGATETSTFLSRLWTMQAHALFTVIFRGVVELSAFNSMKFVWFQTIAQLTIKVYENPVEISKFTWDVRNEDNRMNGGRI